MAVKPWLGAIREPSGWKEGPDVAEAPAADLLLSFVYGYQAQQARSNLCYGATTDDIIFHAAAVGDDITCLAVHPKGHMVATGALGKQPKVIIWDAQTGATLKVLSGLHKRGIACLSFSASGAILATTGLDDDHTLAVYSVTGIDRHCDGRNISNYFTQWPYTALRVLCCAFAGETDIAVGGKSFVKFLTLPAGGRGDVQSKKGIFGKLGTSTTAISCAWVGAHAVTGMADGSLYLWKRVMAYMAASTPGGSSGGLRSGAGALVTGGRDGRVLIWDDQLQHMHAFDLSAATGVDAPLKAEVRSVAAKGGKILVGTGGSEVMEIAIASGTARKLLQAHYQGEMWGLAPHPLLPRVATACADGTIRVWDATARALVHCRSVSGEAHALGFSPGGKHLAGGMTSGDVLVLLEDLSQVVATVKIGAAAIECLAYSPDGLTLAVGAHDACVHLLAAAAGYARRAVCRGHSSYVRHLDFSADSRYLKSNCGAYELLFWEVAKATQVKSATAVRDVKWHTCTCTLGWPVQGIHKPGADGTDVNGVDYHRDLQLLATADDFGHVNLFRYPCVIKGAKAKAYGGHASHVTRVAFSPNGSYLFSAGGNDRALLQWEAPQKCPHR
ncbi:quinon protein alcohol dehydrogenase-like superfamily [Tribonema minus]|uniref:Quinon protein alcohol dehydrogenase-like superfamily n=1 Tax=Tribonema minus TaxID=303371 RepID=A0A835ZDE6_9STRA|nr:quinon protein alcohol dehydrogenase-like superfamily [Tribonema minus]